MLKWKTDRSIKMFYVKLTVSKSYAKSPAQCKNNYLCRILLQLGYQKTVGDKTLKVHNTLYLGSPLIEVRSQSLFIHRSLMCVLSVSKYFSLLKLNL